MNRFKKIVKGTSAPKWPRIAEKIWWNILGKVNQNSSMFANNTNGINFVSHSLSARGLFYHWIVRCAIRPSVNEKLKVYLVNPRRSVANAIQSGVQRFEREYCERRCRACCGRCDRFSCLLLARM